MVGEDFDVPCQADGGNDEECECRVLEPRMIEPPPQHRERSAFQSPPDGQPLLLELERYGHRDQGERGTAEPREGARARRVTARPEVARPRRGGERHRAEAEGQDRDRAVAEEVLEQDQQSGQPGGSGESRRAPRPAVVLHPARDHERPCRERGRRDEGNHERQRARLGMVLHGPAEVNDGGGEHRDQHPRAAAEAGCGERDEKTQRSGRTESGDRVGRRIG